MKVNEAIMNVDEAIKNCGSNWVRPVWWAGSGQAISLFNNRFAVVPSPKGGAQWYPVLNDLLCKWEIVNPENVLGERR